MTDRPDLNELNRFLVELGADLLRSSQTVNDPEDQRSRAVSCSHRLAAMIGVLAASGRLSPRS